MQRHQRIALLVLAFGLLATGMFLAWTMSKTQTSDSKLLTYTYTVVNTYPHDTNAFTEGLIYENGVLYESTGLYGNSALRKVNLTTGEVLQEVRLPETLFGEGIVIVDGKIIQLTWHEQTGLIYDKETFSLLGNFSYTTEGWGITFDGSRLIMSDGSSVLYFLDPVTYQKIGQVLVQDGNVSVANLNELEYMKGDIYANIWHQDRIAIINPETGQVKGYVDLSGIEHSIDVIGQAVLNGVAYDALGDRLFVTGKNWPHLFEVKLVPASEP